MTTRFAAQFQRLDGFFDELDKNPKSWPYARVVDDVVDPALGVCWRGLAVHTRNTIEGSWR